MQVIKTFAHPMWNLLDQTAGVLELRAIREGLPTRTKVFSWLNFGEGSLQSMYEGFEHTAFAWDNAGYNVYTIFNDVDEYFTGSSVKDKDIAARSHFLVDIDRRKKANCPASDAELQHAKDLSDVIRAFMSLHGWLDPLVVMSGNGIHLYYYLNYQTNTPELTEKIREQLRLLGDKFDNSHIKVDRSVDNASRLSKVIGTTAKKGNEKPGRPYRKVKILSGRGHAPGLRMPCLDTLFANTLRALRAGRQPAHKPLTKPRVKFKNVELDDTPNNRALVSSLLSKFSSDCDREIWRSIVWAVMSTGITGAVEMARDWSIQSDRYTETDFDNLIRDYDPNVVGRGGQISIGTLHYHAEKSGDKSQGEQDEHE
jgi:hypothetical protein